MKEAQRLRLLPALPRQGVGVCTGPDFKKEKTKIKGLISLSVSFSSQQLSIHFIAFAYNAPKCDVLHTSRADVAVQCTAGRIGALEGGAHVSTEARVSSRDHARGAFDAHEGCAKASKHCNCDNRASDFPADDAGSVLRRSVTTYAAANALSLSPPPGGGGEGGGAVVVALPTALFFLVARAVEIEIVRAEFYRSYPADGDAKQKQTARRQAFHRALRDAQASGVSVMQR